LDPQVRLLTFPNFGVNKKVGWIPHLWLDRRLDEALNVKVHAFGQTLRGRGGQQMRSVGAAPCC
jgi:hypothetical protein